MWLMAMLRFFLLHWPSPILSVSPWESLECHLPHLLILRLKTSSRYAPTEVQFSPYILKGSTDCVRTPVLVHSCRGPRQTFHTVSLRTTLLREPISRNCKNIFDTHRGLAYFIHFCYLLPSMASPLQLGDLYTYNELHCHVFMLQCDRRSIGHCHSMHSFLIHQDTAHQSKPEIWTYWHFRSWSIVRACLFNSPISFLQSLK